MHDDVIYAMPVGTARTKLVSARGHAGTRLESVSPYGLEDELC
ncbi:unnamed protein product, partial [marine sediment metagenome]